MGNPVEPSLKVNELIQRGKLKIYQPALFISIKSLVAGELYAAQRILRPFGSGYLYAAQRKPFGPGKTIKHPNQNDKVILILDVEEKVFIAAFKQKVILYNEPHDAVNEPQHRKAIWEQYESRVISCNGDCGSKISQLIDSISFPKVHNFIPNKQQIVRDSFLSYRSPLRQTMIHHIHAINPLDANTKYILQYLQDPNCYIKGEEWTDKILQYFLSLKNGGYIHILQALANNSCLLSNGSLLEEIANYHQCFDYKKYQTQIQKIKESDQYHQMISHGLALSDMEILSVLLYCNNNEYCYMMRKSHRKNELNSCQWRHLFNCLCSAIYKIREVFHRNNKEFYVRYIKKRKPWNDKLYHGVHSTHIINDNYCSLHTITSFSEDWSVAEAFTMKDGMILAISNAFKLIYKGELLAANVSWLSNFLGEREFILTPISFNKIVKINESNDNYDMIIKWDGITVYELSKPTHSNHESDQLSFLQNSHIISIDQQCPMLLTTQNETAKNEVIFYAVARCTWKFHIYCLHNVL